jgi:ribA/ribD-fused uncharacterized protein
MANLAKVYTREKLMEQIEKGISFDYLLFYGHKEGADGIIGDICFSQWFPAPFEVNGQNFPTSEHYMMAKKAVLFSDQEMLENILACKTPREAKAFGRKVRNFDAAVWEKQRSRIVVEANLAKFSQNQGMKDFLLASAPKILVEASPRDRIWGIGMGKGNSDALDPRKWRGKNLLGFALLEVRDLL